MNTNRPAAIRACLWCWCCVGAFLLALPSVEGQNPTYSVVGLPPELQAVAFNPAGQVVGYASFNGSTTQRRFIPADN